MIGNIATNSTTTSKEKENQKTKVIVIGAGIGSTAFLKESFKYTDILDITLISPTEFTETAPNTISTLLVKGDEEFITKYNRVVSLQDAHNTAKLYGKYIKQVVTNISHDKVVTLGDGSQIVGDVIIASTGLKLDELWQPITKSTTQSDRIYQLIEFRRNVEMAQSILVIGGGIVAVELVGELITKYPNKQVHIVQSGDRLLPRQSIKASNTAQRSLQSNGAIIHLNHHVIKQGDGYVLKSKLDNNNNNNINNNINNNNSSSNNSNNGNHNHNTNNLSSWNRQYATDPYVFTPDLVINCGGGKPITDYFPKQVINEYGEVKVDEYLQVIGMPDVYAIGDINDVKFSMKSAQGASAQGEYLFKQLLNRINNNNIIINMNTNIKQKSEYDTSTVTTPTTTSSSLTSSTSIEPFVAPQIVGLVTLGDSAALMDAPKFTLVGWFGTGSMLIRWMRKSLEAKIHDNMWPNKFINS